MTQEVWDANLTESKTVMDLETTIFFLVGRPYLAAIARLGNHHQFWTPS